ncbi:MAG: sulfatase-like hydrolase/transferase [Patescibacteria group bacterium]|nr:sulfatase-like hydrolase/transferase [Patescibacteria group bacterium]
MLHSIYLFKKHGTKLAILIQCVVMLVCLWNTLECQTTAKFNIIFISEDQLAAEHIHCYGYNRETTPNLDAAVKNGVLFTRFYASSSWTTPSYCSMMTGLFPSKHQMTIFVRPGAPLLNPALPLLSEQFKNAGYKTVAFDNNGNAGKFILEKGFDEFYQGQAVPQNITEREAEGMMDYRAPGTNKKIFSWLDKNKDNPFFMFVLYFEPHSPYDPPPEHDIFKTGAYPDETHTGYDPVKGKLLRLANAGDKKAVQRLIDLYDGKVHFIDYHFGELLKKLKSLGLDKNTVVILLSDHGEMLYSHPDVLTFDHRSLYDKNIHIPLVIQGPGIPAGKRIDGMGSHIDIAPTILDIAGLPQMNGVQGKSLLPLIKGTATVSHNYIFSEQDISEPMRSVRDDQYKLIYTLRTGNKQLFDIKNDPKEGADISKQNPEIVNRLYKILEQWMKENHPSENEKLKRWRQVITLSGWGGKSAAPKLEGEEITTDDVTIGARLQLNGAGWQMADNKDNFLEACYWTEPGDGTKSAVWRADNPLLGKYEVYFWYGSLPNKKAATNAPFVVTTRKANKEFTINQNENKGKWNLIGIFENPLFVTLTDKADGPLVVDAVKFKRIGD